MIAHVPNDSSVREADGQRECRDDEASIEIDDRVVDLLGRPNLARATVADGPPKKPYSTGSAASLPERFRSLARATAERLESSRDVSVQCYALIDVAEAQRLVADTAGARKRSIARRTPRLKLDDPAERADALLSVVARFDRLGRET